MKAGLSEDLAGLLLLDEVMLGSVTKGIVVPEVPASGRRLPGRVLPGKRVIVYQYSCADNCPLQIS